VALISSIVFLFYLRERPVEGKAVQLQMNPPQGREFQPNDIALSPDGKSLAFVTCGAVSKLWVRGVDSVNPHELKDTDGASLPFWSPDQRSLGFFAGGKLKRIDLAAERVVTLADAPAGRGGSWNADDVIIFCAATNGPIWRISAAGGAPPSQATTLNSPREASHRFPAFLPDGRHFLYYVRAAEPEVRGIYWASIDNPREGRRVVESIYTQSGQTSGEPALIPDMGLLRMGYDRQTPVSASRDGTLVYAASDARFQLTWYDSRASLLERLASRMPSPRTASESHRTERASPYRSLRTSSICGRSTSRRVNGDALPARRGAAEGWLAWSPDGQQIAYLTGGLFTGMRATVFVTDRQRRVAENQIDEHTALAEPSGLVAGRELRPVPADVQRGQFRSLVCGHARRAQARAIP